MGEWLQYGATLQVRSHDDCMFLQVKCEGITQPSTHRFHYVKQDPPEEILQSAPDADTVALEWVEAEGSGYDVYLIQEDSLG